MLKNTFHNQSPTGKKCSKRGGSWQKRRERRSCRCYNCCHNHFLYCLHSCCFRRGWRSGRCRWSCCCNSSQPCGASSCWRGCDRRDCCSPRDYRAGITTTGATRRSSRLGRWGYEHARTTLEHNQLIPRPIGHSNHSNSTHQFSEQLPSTSWYRLWKVIGAADGGAMIIDCHDGNDNDDTLYVASSMSMR